MTDQSLPVFRSARSDSTMMMTLGVVAFIAATAAGAALGTQSTGRVDASDKATIERIVHDYILEHPEIIPQAVEKLQAKRMSGTIDASRQTIETPYAGAWEGAAKGDVTVVEFFDRSEEHTSELQSIMRISYAVFCLIKKKDARIHDCT